MGSQHAHQHHQSLTRDTKAQYCKHYPPHTVFFFSVGDPSLQVQFVSPEPLESGLLGPEVGNHFPMEFLGNPMLKFHKKSTDA